MKFLAPLGRAAVGFFVDDAFLGLATVISVVVAVLCRLALSHRPLIAGALLAGGCLLALTLSVARAAAPTRPMSLPDLDEAPAVNGSATPVREPAGQLTRM